MAVYVKYRMEDDKFCQILKKSTETNDLEITVLFEEKAFKATVKEKDIVASAEKHEKTVKDFAEDLFRGGPEYTAKISPERNTLILNKNLENTSIKVKVFEHKMTKINYAETVEKLLSHFSEEHSRSEREVKRLLSETEELKTIKAKYEEQLERLTELKNSNEEKLYSKFVLVLNEKKTQIQHLSQLLSHKTNRIGPKNRRIASNLRKREEPVASSSTNVQETVSSSSSGSETETESVEHVKEPLQQPSSSSLLLDCDDILNDDFPRPKRHKFDDLPRAEIEHNQNNREKIEIPKLICNKDNNKDENNKEEMNKKVKINAFEINTQDLLDSF